MIFYGEFLPTFIQVATDIFPPRQPRLLYRLVLGVVEPPVPEQAVQTLNTCGAAGAPTRPRQGATVHPFLFIQRAELFTILNMRAT